jgi:hypothetical protein
MLAKSTIVGALALACVWGGAATAADQDVPTPYGAALVPAEHHIIEVAIHPPGSRQFIINGGRYTAYGNACLGWEAGNRISLVEGNWHGWCRSVVFYNHTLRQSCEMSCGYF